MGDCLYFLCCDRFCEECEFYFSIMENSVYEKEYLDDLKMRAEEYEQLVNDY